MPARAKSRPGKSPMSHYCTVQINLSIGGCPHTLQSASSFSGGVFHFLVHIVPARARINTINTLQPKLVSPMSQPPMIVDWRECLKTSIETPGVRWLRETNLGHQERGLDAANNAKDKTAAALFGQLLLGALACCRLTAAAACGPRLVSVVHAHCACARSRPPRQVD